MDRREFLAKAGVLATWAAIPVTLASCGDDDEPTEPENGNDDVDGVVTGSGHSHDVTITRAQLEAAQGVTLTLLASGTGHTHMVTLNAAQVVNIAGGQSVSETSTTDDGHSHTVTFN